MAHAGYQLKVGTYEVPNKFIKYDSWQSTYETLDFDSYRDANGLLHRNAVSRKLKVEFETPIMYKSDFDTFMTNIRGQLTGLEQYGQVKAYIDELGDYVEQKCYLVNVNPKIQQNSPLGLIYQPCRICFIAY